MNGPLGCLELDLRDGGHGGHTTSSGGQKTSDSPRYVGRDPSKERERVVVPTQVESGNKFKHQGLTLVSPASLFTTNAQNDANKVRCWNIAGIMFFMVFKVGMGGDPHQGKLFQMSAWGEGPPQGKHLPISKGGGTPPKTTGTD